MHTLITNLADFKKLQAARAEIDKAARRNAEQVAAAEAKHAKAMAAWLEAGDRGEDPGPQPTLTGVLDPEVRRRFTMSQHEAKRKLRESERDLLAGHAKGLLERYDEIEDDLLAKAAEHVKALDAIATEMSDVVQAVRLLRKVIGDKTGTAEKVDYAAVVDAVHGGSSLLQPTAPTETIIAGTMRYTRRASAVAR